ncbi:ROK family protein [Leifsonia sp. 21MFCrub1.1]|uniref:ROK family protein n=1 Tax=Leifsonia sp. 21MFCrub1.1 TaxID=1798223 RepID=UPI000892914F|nr:ROK family protein [Leifsonia sp. 21MFCrub1.1]SEB09224.1 Sugar kinase of the NBD/HSP70 family, may contain an N-terminal HTH domain [Leifsonia sp. 21MFCrub1.1]
MPSLRIDAPALSARISEDLLASTLARLLASGAAASKPELVRTSGLARSTVDAGVRELLDRGVVRTQGYQQSGGRGRAAAVLELDPSYGYVLVADCGRHWSNLKVFDIRQHPVAEAHIQIEFSNGPDVVLEAIVAGFRELLSDLPYRAVIAVIGLPAPVDHRDGSIVRPPFMPGWDRFPVIQYVSEALGCDVILENDVNLRALGEARASTEFSGPLLYVKVGTGIGVGIVTSDGVLMRGADGSSGEIAHLKVTGHDDICVCGSHGCLETVASVGALTRSMTGAAPATPTTRDERDLFLRRLAEGDPEVRASARRADQHLGEAIANLVHVINPHRIVLGGSLADADEELLATVRSIVYQQALPISTRELTLVRPALGFDSGAAGGLVLGIERVLAPDRLMVADRDVGRTEDRLRSLERER